MAPLLYLHTCGRCGARIRRSRQHTNAAWYKRRGLVAKAFAITWHDKSGSMDCDSPRARTERKERGERDLPPNSDARHRPSVDCFSEGDE